MRTNRGLRFATREVEMSPPIATGFNLKNGTPDMINKPQWFIREATDCMRT